MGIKLLFILFINIILRWKIRFLGQAGAGKFSTSSIPSGRIGTIPFPAAAHTPEEEIHELTGCIEKQVILELMIKLRESTVANQGGDVDNGDRLTPKWAASLRDAVSKIYKESKLENLLVSNDRSGAGSMTFFESIQVCFKKYADFTGRASRAEFWWFTLFATLVVSALAYMSQTLGSVFLIAVLLPLLAVGARRLRDCGRSLWWLIFLLAPIGGLVLVGFLCAEKPVADETHTV